MTQTTLRQFNSRIFKSAITKDKIGESTSFFKTKLRKSYILLLTKADISCQIINL